MKPSDKDPNKIRLQVFLSHNGVCSRREALNIIKDRRVTVNGRVCWEPSTPVNPDKDHVSLDGKRIKTKTYAYILLNKPTGFTTTKADRYAKNTVLDLLPRKYHHLSPVGRLDRDTEGLLLLTNDGDVAYQLTHPKFNVDKTYFARVEGRLEIEKKARLERGVFIDGKRTAPAKIKKGRFLKGQTELTITIHEGRKRQIRIMFAKMKHRVTYLKRLVQGPLILGPLKKGEWRLLKREEIESIKNIA